ncbi:conserved hypothetical protein [Candidatus Desulfarcum epimagneticum]|uniref:Uncharacterized protein n=1 Tax=uncultured Desulfobacteraceae bacterium TaxID=218296 RepID=A0A484HLN7_9BACT|nr:conserved hypothetical protein [uncultured Desulfobacteraceae bacterium]
MTNRGYLIDENVTPAIADQLLRRRPDMDVAVVGGEAAPTKGTGDPDILMWIEAHGFMLVTRNRKSMPEHLRRHLLDERHIPGILTLRPKASLGEIIDDLLLVWELSEPDEYRDQIIHVPF